MQDEALDLMLQDRNLMLPNVGYLKQFIIDETYVCLEITTLQNIS